MDFMSLFDLVILPLIALAAGKWLKVAPWYNTKFIPLGNLVIVVLVKVATALGLTVASAHADPAYGSYAVMGVIGAFGWKSFLWEALKAVLSVLVATGAHSAAKNVKEGLE